MKLHFTTGSPFARAVRITLSERSLSFEQDETTTTPSVDERAKVAPSLQVPTFIDGSLRLWDSSVIIDYLMANYPTVPAPLGHLPFAHDYVRPSHQWHDKLVHASLQTLGVSTVTVSQLCWSGVQLHDNAHAIRCGIRNQHLLNWFEDQITSTEEGFVPGVISAQDVLLACWCEFIERRPLGLTWEAEHRPKVLALVERVRKRPSFADAPVLWWEPGVNYSSAEELAWAQAKTIHREPAARVSRMT